MSDDIIKMSKDFKQIAELELQNKAQFKVITNLTKQNQELQDKVKHLESMLHKTSPVVVQQFDSKSTLTDGEGEPEVDICRAEILKLRNKSMVSELTLEDSKKLETYTKIITAAKNIPKTIEIKAKKLSTDDLLLSLEEGRIGSNEPN